MPPIFKIALLISIILNLLILGLVSIWIHSKGGFSFLLHKVSTWQTFGSKKNSMYDNPYYWDKKSHFETLPKSEADIVFLGDSLTDCCEWQEFFRNVSIKNRGISADTTNGILNRIDEIVEPQPQKVFILIGINDLNQGRRIDDIFNNYQLILKVFKEKAPQTKVFVQSLLPVNNQRFPNNGVNSKVTELNTKLKNLAQDLSFQYIDLFSSFLDEDYQLDTRYTTDGLHLNGQGYLIWQEIIKKNVVD